MVASTPITKTYEKVLSLVNRITLPSSAAKKQTKVQPSDACGCDCGCGRTSNAVPFSRVIQHHACLRHISTLFPPTSCQSTFILTITTSPNILQPIRLTFLPLNHRPQILRTLSRNTSIINITPSTSSTTRHRARAPSRSRERTPLRAARSELTCERAQSATSSGVSCISSAVAGRGSPSIRNSCSGLWRRR